MTKLILPDSIEFNNYKGFIIKVDQIEGSDDKFLGVAMNEGKGEAKTMFSAEGNSRNEVGQKLEKYVDKYRESVKPKLIIS
jgi:hypothetical protein